ALAANGIVSLAWTNAPLTPTTYSIKRGTNSGGPYFTIASNLTEGVRATSYMDTSVSNSTPYFYVVTAVNAFGESTNSAQVSATPVAPLYLAINSGGGAVGSWIADNYFDAGTAYSTTNAINTNGVSNPAPASVYQSQRYGNLTYTLRYLAPTTSYKVRLHFAEVYWNAANQRKFNLVLNGVQVLTNFDIYAAAGGSFKANVQEFNAISDSAGN